MTIYHRFASHSQGPHLLPDAWHVLTASTEATNPDPNICIFLSLCKSVSFMIIIGSGIFQKPDFIGLHLGKVVLKASSIFTLSVAADDHTVQRTLMAAGIFWHRPVAQSLPAAMQWDRV